MSKSRYVFGVDPGVHTGLCLYDRKKGSIVSVWTIGIIEAMEKIKGFHDVDPVEVFIEDARTRSGSKEKALGAGSIRRDCSVWQEWGEYHSVPITWRRVGMTKVKDEMFKKLTGYTERTSSHGRDAAMIVFGMR